MTQAGSESAGPNNPVNSVWPTTFDPEIVWSDGLKMLSLETAHTAPIQGEIRRSNSTTNLAKAASSFDVVGIRRRNKQLRATTECRVEIARRTVLRQSR